MVQQYDYSQMFDGMHLKEALSDLYNTGVKDDTLNLIYDANRRIEFQVKTPHGLTEEVVLDEVVLQGEVWGPILAANQVDTFGSEMIEEDYSFIFKYKGVHTNSSVRPHRRHYKCQSSWVSSCTNEQFYKCEVCRQIFTIWTGKV